MKLRSSTGTAAKTAALDSLQQRGTPRSEVPLLDTNSLSAEEREQIAQYQARTGASFNSSAVDLGLIEHDAMRQSLAIHAEAGQLIDPDETGISRAVVAAYAADDVLTIKLRELRSSLLTVLDLEREAMAVVVLAACGTNDSAGVAANLATLFAQLGKPGLIVDANFSAPTQDVLFGIDATEGATSLLTGGSNRDDCVTLTPVPNLDMVASGPAISGLSEAVERVSLIEQLRALRTGYRFAIIDVGNQPADIVAAIARGADGVLLLAERRQTSMIAVRSLIERLDANQVPLFGSVLIR